MKTGYSKLTLVSSASNGGNFSIISNNYMYIYNYDKNTRLLPIKDD